MMQSLFFYIIFIGITKELIVLNEKLLVAIAFLIVIALGQSKLSSVIIEQLEARANLIKQQYEEYFNSQKTILVELANFHKIRANNSNNNTANELYQLVNDLILKIKSNNQAIANYKIQSTLYGHLESIKTLEAANLTHLQNELLKACAVQNSNLRNKLAADKQGKLTQDQKNKIIHRAIERLATHVA